MRKILLALCLLFSFFAFGQTDEINLPVKNGTVSFEEIVTVDSVKQDDLYKRAKLWVINTFKSEKSVTSTADKELGEIKGTGIFSISVEHTSMFFSFRISVKDNKYRYVFDEFYAMDNYGRPAKIGLTYYYDYYKSGKKLVRGIMTKFVVQSKEKIEQLIESLKTAMIKPGENW